MHLVERRRNTIPFLSLDVAYRYSSRLKPNANSFFFWLCQELASVVVAVDSLSWGTQGTRRFLARTASNIAPTREGALQQSGFMLVNTCFRHLHCDGGMKPTEFYESGHGL